MMKLYGSREIPGRGRAGGAGGGQGGFSLLEAAVALALGSIGVVMVSQAFTATTNSLDYTVKDGVSSSGMQAVVSGLCSELRQSAADEITITTTTPCDRVSVRMYDSVTETYGAEDANGTFATGWRIFYWVDTATGELWRQTLDASGAVRYENVVLRNVVVDPTGGVKGFSVTRSGTLYSVGLNLTEHMSDGATRSRNLSSTVHVSS